MDMEWRMTDEKYIQNFIWKTWKEQTTCKIKV
jgi:hypothetical protein